MKTQYKVGIDIGSTTIKLVVLDQELKPVYKNYRRHRSEIYDALLTDIKELAPILTGKSFTCAITGSAGMGMATDLGIPFVQEVIAGTKAVREWIPETDVAIELGGEDAKITYLGTAPEQRMNGVCAGGTGSFIDHMAALLNTDAGGLNELAKEGKQIYSIASRCGVFAKTDVQALLNEGASKADIAISIFQAVVNQTIGNLAQGRPILGKVTFLGGPLHFLDQLKLRFIETLKLDKEHIVEVDDGCYFVAKGCAICDEATEFDFAGLMDKLNNFKGVSEQTGVLNFNFFKNKDDYQKFIHRHEQDKVARGDLATYEGPLYLGIDAGSTTTKLLAIGKNKEVLYTSYGSNNGSPLSTIVERMKEFYKVMPKKAYLASVGTTGYGEHIIKAALHADIGEVETFAHLRAAREFCPEVSCVLDIGGQDMKCFYVKDGNIAHIVLNEACSAGCGSFIQNFAQGLNMEVKDFAKKGLTAEEPVDLGTRCTVFMNSRVKQAQKEGAAVSDISAGIALSVIKNALFKVIQVKDVAELGDHIVVQGGTFYNDTVLRALELLLKKDVIRPDIAGLMGAYGMALLGWEHQFPKSSVIGPESLESFDTTSKSYRCKGCGNSCLITMQTFPDGNRYYTGNRCERGIGKQVKPGDKAPNMYLYKYQRLFEHYKSPEENTRGVIGIPRVLNMYEDYPFWFTFFNKLGFKVQLSGKSSAAMFCKGMSTIPSDSLCYPGKLVHGHIMDLVEKGIKTIFYPCLPYTLKDDVHPSETNYNCPIVASYAENIRTNMDILKEKNVRFLQPFLPINNKERLVKRLMEELKDALGLNKSEVVEAIEAAYEELMQYKYDVRAKGKEYMDWAKEHNAKIIVLGGRPYHIDPEINHGIPELIQGYNIVVLSEDSIYHLVDEVELEIVNQWSYHSRIYHAAAYIADHKENMSLIQLSSFGCGLDAITSGQIKELLESHGSIYTLIKLDEVSNLGAARIRIRSLIASWEYGTGQEVKALVKEPRPYFSKEKFATHTILAPQLSPRHFDFVQQVCGKYNFNVVIPELPDKEAIDLGLRYINNDMCYPAIIVIGQLLHALKSGKYDVNNCSIMMFQTCGACRATNYLTLMRIALKNAGLKQVPVFAAMGLDTDDFKMSTQAWIEVMKATIYADLLEKLVHRTRPYEQLPGSADVLYAKWRNIFFEELREGSYLKFRKNIRNAVKEFDKLPLIEGLVKPRVAIVGEILAKYHPVANNNIEKVLAAEGMEVVMPDLTDFYMYMAYDDVIKHKMFSGSLNKRVVSEMVIQFMEFYRRPMRKALEASKRFHTIYTIKELADMTKDHVSLGNMAGEGWFLTAEMIKLIKKEDVKNIICLQPFGCMPNHITGEGMVREMRRIREDLNIVMLDCDAGISEVNQLNRIKLMLAVAREDMNKDATAHKS